jgi:hypothetical protein
MLWFSNCLLITKRFLNARMAVRRKNKARNNITERITTLPADKPKRNEFPGSLGRIAVKKEEMQNSKKPKIPNVEQSFF